MLLRVISLHRQLSSNCQFLFLCRLLQIQPLLSLIIYYIWPLAVTLHLELGIFLSWISPLATPTSQHYNSPSTATPPLLICSKKLLLYRSHIKTWNQLYTLLTGMLHTLRQRSEPTQGLHDIKRIITSEPRSCTRLLRLLCIKFEEQFLWE